jgi:hypothetical protein
MVSWDDGGSHELFTLTHRKGIWLKQLRKTTKLNYRIETPELIRKYDQKM